MQLEAGWLVRARLPRSIAILGLHQISTVCAAERFARKPSPDLQHWQMGAHLCSHNVHPASCRLPCRQCFLTYCVPLRLQTSPAHLSMGETTEHAASALQERLSSSDGANSSATVQEPSTAASQPVCAEINVSN